MSVAGWLNTAWRLSCEPESRRFHAATWQVAAVQEKLLSQTLHRNRLTEFGRRHHFESIRTPREYLDRVPLSTYDDYAEAIDRIAHGEPNILTSEPVVLLEPTSGTTSGEKLIPYTATLRREFQRAVAAWIADLFRFRPAAASGRAYWSISPAARMRNDSPAGPPIGFDDDASYLSGWQQLLVRRVLAVSSEVAQVGDPSGFRYVTLLHLLAARDLSLISIWNPTFLPTILAPLTEWQRELCRDLQTGGCSPPCPVDGSLRQRLALARPMPQRAEEVAAIVRSSSDLSEVCRQLWTSLALVSTWTDASAAQFVPDLQRLFPTVELQPKGLLATEGCVTIPIAEQPAPVLAVRSHFFEFQPCDDHGGIKGGGCMLAQELCQGATYRVVITTGGGLYRYQLGDVVEVIGFMREAPLLRFLGKGDCVSDLVGEKLAEPFVRQALTGVFAELGLAPQFALLVPVLDRLPRYRLYYQPPASSSVPSAADEMAARLQGRLASNPYYRSAVALGQLGPLEVCRLSSHTRKAWELFQEAKVQQGHKAGALKPIALDVGTDWPSVFDPLCDDSRYPPHENSLYNGRTCPVLPAS